MRRTYSLGSVVTTFGIPAGAPPEVEAAWKRFDALVTKHVAARDALATAERGVAVARGKDRDAAAQAIIDGNDAPPAKNEQKALAEVERQQQVLAATEHALDIVGDELAAAIAAHQEEWVASASKEAEAAYARFRTAIGALRVEGQALASTRGALKWLANVEVVTEHPIGHAVVEANMPGTDKLPLARPALHRLRTAATAPDLLDALEEIS